MNWEQIRACWEDSELLRRVDAADLEVWADQFPAVPLFKALLIRKQIIEQGSPDPVLWQRLLLQWPEPDIAWLQHGGRSLPDIAVLTGADAVPGEPAPEEHTEASPQPEDPTTGGLHLSLPHLGFLYEQPGHSTGQSEPVAPDSENPPATAPQEEQQPASSSTEPAGKTPFSLEGLLPHLGFVYSLETPVSGTPTAAEIPAEAPARDSSPAVAGTVDTGTKDTAETTPPLHTLLPHLGFLWQLPAHGQQDAQETPTGKTDGPSGVSGDSAPVSEQNNDADLPQPPASRIFSSMEQDKYTPQLPGEDTDPDTGYHPSSFIRWLRSRSANQEEQSPAGSLPVKQQQSSHARLVRPEETDLPGIDIAGERKELKAHKKDKKTKKKKKKDKKQRKKEALEAFIYKSLDEPEELVSETFAALLAEQGHRDKAIQMYEKLRLRYPEKSSFFASTIEDLKKRT